MTQTAKFDNEKHMDLKKISAQIEGKLSGLFEELRSGISEREDSRAFGAMVEKRIADHWERICCELGYGALDRPGRRTIFDFAFLKSRRIVGVDVKTKDLDSTRYSDGGICAVGNLLKFLVKERGIFLIAEFGHNKSLERSSKRDIEYIRVVPFVMLPQHIYRIENLGTGQVRLNCTVNQVWDEIDWNRDIMEFYELFVDLAVQHYQRVSRDAGRRIEALQQFRENEYRHFTFGRR